MEFALIWAQDGIVLQGLAGDGTWVTNPAAFPIAFPGRKTDAIALTLRSSARERFTLETLQHVRLYLTGPDVPMVQEVWPYLGDAFTPARPEVSGGFEVSFDAGRTWTRFSKTAGYEKDPATWIPLPAVAVGLDGVDGQIGPFDQAHLLVRYTIPPQAATFKVLDVRLGADVDIV